MMTNKNKFLYMFILLIVMSNESECLNHTSGCNNSCNNKNNTLYTITLLIVLHKSI